MHRANDASFPIYRKGKGIIMKKVLNWIKDRKAKTADFFMGLYCVIWIVWTIGFLIFCVMAMYKIYG